MKNALWIGMFFILLTACAGPQNKGAALPPEPVYQQAEYIDTGDGIYFDYANARKLAESVQALHEYNEALKKRLQGQ